MLTRSDCRKKKRNGLERKLCFCLILILYDPLNTHSIGRWACLTFGCIKLVDWKIFTVVFAGCLNNNIIFVAADKMKVEENRSFNCEGNRMPALKLRARQHWLCRKKIIHGNFGMSSVAREFIKKFSILQSSVC